MTISRRRLVQGATIATMPAILSRRGDAAEFDYKFATNQPLSHPSNIRAQEAIDRIRDQSNGRLRIRLFPNNQLGGDTDMFSQVRAGAIQFFLLSGLIVQTVVPAAGANGVGFAFKDYSQVWAAMDGAFGAYLRQQMLQAGLYAFPKIWDNGFRQVTAAAKPIHEPGDLQGFKIRVPIMPITTSLFESYGAAPTSLNIKDLYTALQTKLVDGQENPLSIMANWRLYEVQKFCALTDHMWDGFWVISSRKTWGALPEDLQTIVSRNLDIGADAQRADVQQLNASLQDDLEKKGIQFNPVDKASFREKLQQAGFYAKWKKNFGPECWGLLEKYTGTLA
jgi:TRAP-type transport system periplasmic protein